MAGNDHAAASAPAGERGDARFLRLLRLAGTDEGFFMLALHSFTESYINAEYPTLRSLEKFPEKLWEFGSLLKQWPRHDVEDLRNLTRISKEHFVTNKVRHDFAPVDREEMLAATHNFLRFCSFRGISDPALDKLRQDLDAAWDEKKSPLERCTELKKLRFDLFIAQRDNRKLLERLTEYGKEVKRLAELDAEVKRLAEDLARERERADSKAERVDRLRRELNDAEQARKQAEARLAGHEDLEAYVEHLNRFHLYTRTRQDYERSLMKLTAEQKAALDAFRLGRDFLIRGGAGTGKTIVLLYALSKVLKEKAADLGLAGPARTVLLTYTKTLVKYDRYIAELLKTGEGESTIQTADAFFLSRLKKVDGRYFVDYKLYDRLAHEMNDTGFLSDEELKAEVEDFLLGNLVSREEYVDNRVPRRGMRQPLSAAQREKVWAIRDRMTEAMEKTGGLSKNRSRMRLIEHMKENPQDDRLKDCDFIFLDESQDLTAADLAALKALSGRGVIMAGDTGQAIYGVGSPYKRAGIEISGRTRVLRTNFRNTCPIAELAEAYRNLGGEAEDHAMQAFREGPPPELYRAATREELLRLLADKASLFIDRLGYDPENLTVLMPSKSDMDPVTAALQAAGHAAASIQDDRFQFSEEKKIRLSTLHSSKGLDFPVVLLYLPGLPPRGEYDEKAAETLMRNLIYVAMTRAMDDLCVFAPEAPTAKPILDLVETYRGREGAGAG